MKLKHTPGKWYYENEIAYGRDIKAKNGDEYPEWIASVNNASGNAPQRSSEEVEANARLIAAAPEYQDIVIRLVQWNTKYPTSRIYNVMTVQRIAAEMDEICNDAIKLIESTTGKNIEEVLE